MNAFTNVGGCWAKTTRGGEAYLLVKLELPDRDEPIFVMLFKNKFKLNALDGRPDMIAYQPSNEPEVQEQHPF